MKSGKCVKAGANGVVESVSKGVPKVKIGDCRWPEDEHQTLLRKLAGPAAVIKRDAREDKHDAVLSAFENQRIFYMLAGFTDTLRHVSGGQQYAQRRHLTMSDFDRMHDKDHLLDASNLPKGSTWRDVDDSVVRKQHRTLPSGAKVADVLWKQHVRHDGKKTTYEMNFNAGLRKDAQQAIQDDLWVPIAKEMEKRMELTGNLRYLGWTQPYKLPQRIFAEDIKVMKQLEKIYQPRFEMLDFSIDGWEREYKMIYEKERPRIEPRVEEL
eukprot:gene2209-8501_t